MRSDIVNRNTILMLLALSILVIFMAAPAGAQERENIGNVDLPSTNAALINSEQTYLNANSNNDGLPGETLSDGQVEIHEAWFYAMGIIILVLALKAKDGSEKIELDRH